MNSSENKIIILGAGLVGSLLALFLIKRGYTVHVFEKRTDLRLDKKEEGRSINLALSRRGLKALEKVGLTQKVISHCIPMPGRMVHTSEGVVDFQPYGKKGQQINSIARLELNCLLMDSAEEAGVHFHFEHFCGKVDTESNEAYFTHQGQRLRHQADFIFGADGAFSALRTAYMRNPRFNFSQEYISSGYKELSMPPTSKGEFALDPNALHIWPRQEFMLIALPNVDKSFTCTLFLPFEGPTSFDTLKTDAEVSSFFEAYFSDAKKHMPDLLNDFQTHPTSALITIKCFPYVQQKSMLIGDAAHAIVPFYGQGMNAGFEDCFVLDRLIDEYHGLNEKVLRAFQEERKVDADAISDLALYNFIEMRDKVTDPEFILQKKIEKRLHEAYPEEWVPLYSLVTFSDYRYSEALAFAKKQQAIMDKVLKTPNIASNWECLDLTKIIEEIR